MSPTILAMLAAVERKIQRDRAATFFDLRDTGYTARRAHYYSARGCWPDAHTTLRVNLAFTSRTCRTYYGSTALASVGIA